MAITFYGNDPNAAPLDAYYIISTFANSTYTFIKGTSDHEFLVSNLKSIVNANGAVYIMVVNGSATSPYTGNRAEPINLKVERKEDFLKRLQMNDELDLRVSCNAHYSNSLGNESDTNSYYLSWGFNSIQWSGNGFYSNHEALNQGDDYYVDGSVDLVNKTITLTFTFNNVSQTNTSHAEATYTMTNVPIHSGEGESTPYDYYPRVVGAYYGPISESYVTSISHTGFTDAPGSDPDYTYTWSNFAWPDPSQTQGDYICIRFMKDFID
jgi:hypothetical protein